MLKHGILGLLNYGEMTGYEIREAFQSSLNFFWPAQTSQIYHELEVLEGRGWIEKRAVEQSGRPNKNICSITEEGRAELLRWLSDPAVNTDLRSPVLMKVFFMGELPVSGGLEFFRQLEAECRAAQAALQQTGASIAAYQELVPDRRSAMFWQMTAEFGKRYAEMYLGWLEGCISLLEGMEGRP